VVACCTLEPAVVNPAQAMLSRQSLRHRHLCRLHYILHDLMLVGVEAAAAAVAEGVGQPRTQQPLSVILPVCSAAE
jgi:hypothetical protein